MQRFWDKVQKTEGCWVWTRATRNGYGCMRFEGKIYDTHRIVWFLTYGIWPSKWVLHKCNNRLCVRPEHLYDGTPKENYWDMRIAGNASLRPQKWANKNEKNVAMRSRNLEYWHKRGKYLRDIRKGRKVNIPV